MAPGNDIRSEYVVYTNYFSIETTMTIEAGLSGAKWWWFVLIYFSAMMRNEHRVLPNSCSTHAKSNPTISTASSVSFISLQPQITHRPITNILASLTVILPTQNPPCPLELRAPTLAKAMATLANAAITTEVPAALTQLSRRLQ